MNSCIHDESCTRKVYARGLCNSHYVYHRKHGTIDSVALPSMQPISSKHTMSNVDPTKGTGICSVCGPVECYKRPEENAWRCREKRRTSERQRNKPSRYYPYGDGKTIPPDVHRKARAELEAAQANQCAICGVNTVNLNLDHCHETGKIRGLLCRPCNTGLGMFRDNVEVLGSAMAYLEVHLDGTA